MSSKFRVSDVGRYVGQEITLKGWLYNKRSSGKLHFLQLRDGSGKGRDADAPFRR